MAKMIVDTERVTARQNDNWDIATYPRPLPPDTRPKKVAAQRMLWRLDGSLACDIGKEYPIEHEDRMIPADEWAAIDHTPASLRPVKVKKASK